MAFAARRGLASRLSHHLTRRLHPAAPHLLASHSHSDDEPTSPSPPLQSPPPHLRPSRTPSLLPFPFHQLAGSPPRRGFSASAPSPAAPSGEVDAAASVLADAAEAAAAASVPAPFPGEVAAAAADSFIPVAALQHIIDAVHTFTGLNWWACIALTTLLIRSVTIPLLMNQMRTSAKLQAIQPQLQAIKDETDTYDYQSSLDGKAKMTALFKKHGVSPFAPVKGLLIQVPVFMSFFFAISNMVEKVPSMKGGGLLWFTDLTTPDPLYILPVLTGLTFLVTVELNMQEGMEGNPMAGKMKNFSRGMAVLSVPFTMGFAKGIFCYWITSNIFTLLYGLVARQPAVRKYFNLPALGAKPSLNLFGGSKGIPSVQSPLAIAGAQRSLEQPDAAALGYRVKNNEKKAKFKGKSRRRR